MPRRKKSAVRKGQGVMCNICGKNCGKGGALKKHVEGSVKGHGVSYDIYKKCFYNEAKTIIADEWNGSVKTSKRRDVITHVLVRRFIGNVGPRGVTRAARVNK